MIKIKPTNLRGVLIDIKKNRFRLDGCNCGEYEYQLDNNLYVGAYRSCHKSSSTTDNNRWELHDITLYKKTDEWCDYGQGEPVELQLDPTQLEAIRTRMRRVSILQTGGTETEYIGYPHW